jgi:hypothetical protein
VVVVGIPTAQWVDRIHQGTLQFLLASHRTAKVAAALNERVNRADNNVISDAVDNAISELPAEQI